MNRHGDVSKHHQRRWRRLPALTLTDSLANRTLALIVIVLLVGLGGAIFAIDRAYVSSAEQALMDRLQGHVVALVAAIELDEQANIMLANPLSEPRFFSTDSGLQARVRRNDGADDWRSLSAQGAEIVFPVGLARNERRYSSHVVDGRHWFAFSLGVSWEEQDHQGQVYTFSVAEDLTVWQEEIDAFRELLLGWMSGVAAVLIIGQGLVLRWVFRPLRRVSGDLKKMKEGMLNRLEGSYPLEMQPLVDNLNALLETRQQQLRRSREALGDLAHSLKTPLAVLRSAMDSGEPSSHRPDRELVQQQLDRMSKQIEYRLQRAATSGQTVLATPVDIGVVLERLCDALQRVHQDRQIRCECLADEAPPFYGDEGDLMELLGNVLDNAFKWCRHRVRVTAGRTAGEDGGLEIIIEDDGPGIPPAMHDVITRRGVRADDSVPGQGIGLAVAQDIVMAYQGEMRFASATSGGTKLIIRLPLQVR